MPDFLLLMRDDGSALPEEDAAWADYLASLRANGCFRGGSAIGSGIRCRKSAPAEPIDAGLTGFIRVEAADLAAATRLLEGNPTYESGGTVEIRELQRSD